jgi:hypothetical protein
VRAALRYIRSSKDSFDFVAGFWAGFNIRAAGAGDREGSQEAKGAHVATSKAVGDEAAVYLSLHALHEDKRAARGIQASVWGKRLGDSYLRYTCVVS